MRIVLVGEANAGSRTPQRQRALEELGHQVVLVATTPRDWTYETRPSVIDRVRYRLRVPQDRAGANAALAAAAAGADLVVLDNARTIRLSTLRRIRELAPRVRLVWYSEDDSMNPRHRTRWLESCIKEFDLWVTTKSFNADPDELPALGARRIMVVDNSYCLHAHAPIAADTNFAAQVSFVGTFEEPRAGDLLSLANAGIGVRVWGNGWDKMVGRSPRLAVECRPVYGDDYRRVVCSSAINLCFLRKGNRDRQTCRSLEIPAMGGFMLHEASDEMERLLVPEHEVAYFSSRTELIGQCERWLADDERRRWVAAAGHARIIAGNHSHHARWQMILARALEN
jgi:spore maturation protein CgeB